MNVLRIESRLTKPRSIAGNCGKHSCARSGGSRKAIGDAKAVSIREEANRDSPPGAGAAPGGQNEKPRAGSRRRKRDQRSLKFYGSLNQIPSITRPLNAKSGSEYPVPGEIIVKGEFRGLARWLSSPFAADTPRTGISPARPGEAVLQNEDPGAGGDELGVLLAAIADEVHRHASAAREGILADFAARAAHARKHLPRNLLAATLASIKQQRKAALALISRNASLEIAGRRKAAIAAFGKDRSGKRPRGPQTNAHNPAPKL